MTPCYLTSPATRAALPRARKIRKDPIMRRIMAAQAAESRARKIAHKNAQRAAARGSL